MQLEIYSILCTPTLHSLQESQVITLYNFKKQKKRYLSKLMIWPFHFKAFALEDKWNAIIWLKVNGREWILRPSWHFELITPRHSGRSWAGFVLSRNALFCGGDPLSWGVCLVYNSVWGWCLCQPHECQDQGCHGRTLHRSDVLSGVNVMADRCMFMYTCVCAFLYI